MTLNDQAYRDWLARMPKAELHVHIDGTLQAQRLLSLAKKNRVELPFKNAREVAKAYDFKDLQSFLDLYYLGASVLKDESDFYHLMMDYLLRCKAQNIVHTEIMIEPQTYLPNGVSFETMMNGFNKATEQASSEWGQSSLLILSFLRHLSQEEALQTLEQAKPYTSYFSAIGLASSEVGNPPKKFEQLYKAAGEQGYKAIAHAGEEGPPQYIWDSLEILKVQRIDHGVRCVEDRDLIAQLKRDQTPLTVCPLSNVRLCVFNNMRDHNVLSLLDQGLMVTINSDDPAYFGGYMNENYWALADALNMTKEQAIALNENSFHACFLELDSKQKFLDQLQKFYADN